MLNNIRAFYIISVRMLLLVYHAVNRLKKISFFVSISNILSHCRYFVTNILQLLLNNFELSQARTNISSSNNFLPLNQECENVIPRGSRPHFALFSPFSLSVPSSPKTPILKPLIQDTWCMADSNLGAVVYRDSRKAR